MKVKKKYAHMDLGSITNFVLDHSCVVTCGAPDLCECGKPEDYIVISITPCCEGCADKIVKDQK